MVNLESREWWLGPATQVQYNSGMSTLAEIEEAAAKLLVEQQQALLLFIAERLRAERGAMRPPRKFGTEQIRQWIAEDEAEGKRFREGA